MSSRNDPADSARTKNRRAALRMPGPPQLPPHPEGLKPSPWPPIMGLIAFGLLLYGAATAEVGRMAIAGVAILLVLVWGTLSRSDPKKQLLYTYIIGRRQFMQGDYRAALANFTDMEESDFATPAVLRGIALASYHLALWAETASYLEDVPELTGGEELILAHCLAELGELGRALETLGRAEEPGAPEAVPYGTLIRSITAFREGRAGETAQILAELLAVAGGDAAPGEEPYLGARYWLGRALRDEGREDDACRLWDDIYELNPRYQDVATLLGRPLPADEDEEDEGAAGEEAKDEEAAGDEAVGDDRMGGGEGAGKGDETDRP